MEIEAKEWVRLKDGRIRQFKQYVDKEYIELTRPYNVAKVKDIVRHSKIISEIVEVGDYVNGKLIHKIDKGPNYCYLYYGNCKTFVDYQIKTIVTKEQMASIEYKVEEDK